ncbi:MAG: hypothetical protein D6748_02110, partial [Calditrichaeota bacterium]
ITSEDVYDAPSFEEIADDILSFVDNYPIIAHNVTFDLSFLEHHVAKVKGDSVRKSKNQIHYQFFGNYKIDTVLLARTFLPYLNSYSLSSLINYFQLELENAHRALPDAEAAGKLFLELLKIALRTKFQDINKILTILAPTNAFIKPFFENLAIVLSSGRVEIPSGITREEFTLTSSHYNIIGAGEGKASPTLEVNPIDPDEVAGFFEEGGELSREFGLYEVRKSQVIMAHAIAEAFNNSQFLVVEAGTGTGKSLAYLVPAIKWALKNYGPYGRVIISTNTKNLQEQLFFKDLPVLHSILKEPFKAVLLKGKANYLCLDKWTTIMSDMESRLTERERENILPLYFWVQNTKTGDISENNAFRVERNYGLWSKFIAENNYCPGKSCKYYDKCYLMRARNNAKDAHIVLVNHSLLFSDLATEHAILSDYVNVIFDEAHNIEKTATEYLGISINIWEFREFLNKLYVRERIETGLLIQLKRRIQKGTLKRSHLDSLNRQIDDLIELITASWRTVQYFFKELTSLLRERTPEASEVQYASKHRYTEDDRLMEALDASYSELNIYLQRLQSALHDIYEYLNELPEEKFEYQRQITQEINSQLLQIEALKNNLEFLLIAGWENYVFWYELPSRMDSDDTRLYAAPLEVGPILSEKLYSKLHTAIFTSATLAVNRDFHYFIQRVGLNHVPPERLEKLLLPSPFNYPEQVLLAIPTFIPEPGHPDYGPKVKELFREFARELPRGTLALFTSYSMLNNVYQAVRDEFEAEGILLLGQGIDGSRHTLITRFKNEETSFLLGTDSFWEGVDVPGKAMEVVLITRLPFDVPSDPVIQARTEMIKKRGGNPFMEYAIPEAVLRFRQGFGRLIRNQSDYGAVIILDTRVTKKFYGSIFLQSLPVEPRLFSSKDEFWSALKNWFL